MAQKSRNKKRRRVTKRQYRIRQITALSVLSLVLVVSCGLLIHKLRQDEPVQSTDLPQMTTQATLVTSTVPDTTETTTAVTDTTTGTLVSAQKTEAVVQTIQLSQESITLQVGESKTIQATLQPASSADKLQWTVIDGKNCVTVSSSGSVTAKAEGSATIQVAPANNPSLAKKIKVQVKAKATGGSTPATEATYINGILIANKSYALPESYAPGVEPAAQAAFNEMKAAAAKEKINLYISSGYRSYASQKKIYNSNVAAYGKEKTDTFSARPGYSEHQTGLAFDVNIINDTFAGTPEAIWLEKHCAEYGFIIRYPKGKESITGYKYEPWHIRYLGKEISRRVAASGKTLEEYLGIDSKYAN